VTKNAEHRDVTYLARESNVMRVDFGREPDDPALRFPGAGALRSNVGNGRPSMRLD
jgi:hypothetical protein